MTFSVFVEHEVIDGTIVTEQFNDVEQIINTPMNETITLRLAGEQSEVNLHYGNVAMVTDNDRET